MTVQIIETIGGAVAAAGTGSATITTSLVSTDRVVVVVSKASTAGTPSVSGLGATWANDAVNTATADLYYISATGVTGGGSISIPGFSSAGDFVVYVLRSTVATTPYAYASLTNNTSGVSGGTLLSVSATTAPANSMVIATGFVNSGTIDFPHSSSTPSGGWTVDRTGSNAGKFIHQAMTSSTSVALSLTSNAVYGGVIARVVYHDDSVPSVTSFAGWGIPIF